MNTGRQSPGLPYGSLIFYLSFFFFLGGGNVWNIYQCTFVVNSTEFSFYRRFQGQESKIGDLIILLFTWHMIYARLVIKFPS